MSTTTEPRDSTEYDYDVVIVGGGPAGCSAGIFCAREGLDTQLFDRGRSSISRCAHLENYLGFPAGIDVETFYELMGDHAEQAGCAIVSDLVESVEHTDDEGFRIEPQEGDPVTARRVVAATRYDGEYMRGLDTEAEMFETYEHDGEEREHFDGSYAEFDGSTRVERLYVVSPSEEDTQATMAAGRGARVARRVVADAKLDDGWWEPVAGGVDWVRREAELDDEWAERERWIEWFDDYYGEDAPVAPDTERFRRVRGAEIDGSLSSYVTPAEIESRVAAGHEALAARIDEDTLLESLDHEVLLGELDERGLLEERSIADGDGDA